MATRFEMELRGQQVHVTATIIKFDPSKAAEFTIEIRNRAGRLLEWELTRPELVKICRTAAKAASN